jgi:hypothetical protein
VGTWLRMYLSMPVSFLPSVLESLGRLFMDGVLRLDLSDHWRHKERKTLENTSHFSYSIIKPLHITSLQYMCCCHVMLLPCCCLVMLCCYHAVLSCVAAMLMSCRSLYVVLWCLSCRDVCFDLYFISIFNPRPSSPQEAFCLLVGHHCK